MRRKSLLSMAEPVLGRGAPQDRPPALHMLRAAPRAAHLRWASLAAAAACEAARAPLCAGGPCGAYAAARGFAQAALLRAVLGWPRGAPLCGPFSALCRAQLRGVASVPGPFPGTSWSAAAAARSALLRVVAAQLRSRLRALGCDPAEPEGPAEPLLPGTDDGHPHGGSDRPPGGPAPLVQLLARAWALSDRFVPLEQLETDLLRLCNAIVPKTVGSAVCSFLMRAAEPDNRHRLQT